MESDKAIKEKIAKNTDSSTKVKVDITEEHKHIARQIIAQARLLGVLSMRGGFEVDDWKSEIQFQWRQGRHGARDSISMQTTFYATSFEEIDEVKK